MSALIGALRVTLGLDSAAFEKGASAIEKRSRKMERDLQKMGAGMSDLGQKLSLAVTVPLVAFAATSVKAAMESREALGQVEATLASMGNAAGRTSAQLQELASGQMRKSLYDDDEILRKVTANLLTFGSVAGDNFDRAQQAAIDLSARLGQDLQNSTLMIGKALNEPIKGLAALRRVGIQFTEQQQDQIKAMAEAGDVAGAQAVMLKELERQFGGAAEAARKANPFAALKNSFDDLQETIGEKLIPVITPLIDKLAGLIDAFSTLPEGVQSTAIALGAIAAAAGPLLMGLGGIVQAMAPLLAVLATVAGEGGLLLAAKAAFIGLGTALAPILAPLAAIAAVGALIYANWDRIGPVLSEFWETAKAALGPEIQAMVETLKTTLSDLWNGPLGAAIQQAIANFGDFAVFAIKAFGPAIIAVIKALVQVLTGLFQMIGDGVRLVKAVFEGDWRTAITSAASLFNRMFGGLPAFVIGVMAKLVGGIKTWITDKLNAIWDGAVQRIEQVKKMFFGLYDAVVGHSYIPDMVDGIAAQMDRLDAVMVAPVASATAKAKEAFRSLAGEVAPLLDRLFPEASDMREFRKEVDLIGRAVKAGILTPLQGDEAQRRLATEGLGNGTIDGLLTEYGAPLEGFADLTEVIQDRLSKVTGGLVMAAGKTKATTVAIAKSFKDMADETLSALNSMVNAIKGGNFLDIVTSVVGFGLQLGSIGLFGKTIAGNINSAGIPGYAGGTSFHPGGWAKVGEKGPELVNLPRGSQVWPNGTGPGGAFKVVLEDTTGLFKARVEQISGGVVAAAAPAIAAAGGASGVRSMRRMQQRSLA